MKKFLGLLTLGLAIISTNLMGAEVTILHTNDLHAHVEPFLFRGLDANRKVGGFANITTYVKNVKEQEKGKREVLFLDAGDYFTGPYISSLTEGEAIIDIMNTMEFDAVTVGNHEFDHGWENGREKLKQATFPIVLGNVYEDKTGNPFWDKPYMIIERDGLKIGVIGLHGVFAFNDTVAAIMRKGITAQDEDEHLKKYIAELKDKTDIVILLVHQGIPARQSSFGGDDVERALKRDIDMAKTIPGIDILVTGHAHQGTPEPIKINDTLIVSTNGQGSQVGRLDFTYDEKIGKITKYNGKLVTIYDDEITPDTKTQESIDKWKNKIDGITSKVIGQTDKTLTRSYGTESLLVNLFGDSLMEAGKEFGSQFAVTNSGGIRNDIESGEITFGTIISAAPFPNELTILDLTGAQVEEMFEHAAGLTNGVLQVSSEVRMTYNPEKEVGKRITKLTINGEKIDKNKKYRVATNDFLANGGDGFSSFLDGTNRVGKGGYMVYSAMIDYISKRGTVSPQLEERVITVK